MIFILTSLLIAAIFYIYDYEAAKLLDIFTAISVFGTAGALVAMPVTFILMLIAWLLSEYTPLDAAPLWIFFPFSVE